MHGRLSFLTMNSPQVTLEVPGSREAPIMSTAGRLLGNSMLNGAWIRLKYRELHADAVEAHYGLRTTPSYSQRTRNCIGAHLQSGLI